MARPSSDRATHRRRVRRRRAAQEAFGEGGARAFSRVRQRSRPPSSGSMASSPSAARTTSRRGSTRSRASARSSIRRSSRSRRRHAASCFAKRSVSAVRVAVTRATPVSPACCAAREASGTPCVGRAPRADPGNASRNLAITVGLVRRKNVLMRPRRDERRDHRRRRDRGPRGFVEHRAASRLSGSRSSVKRRLFSM